MEYLNVLDVALTVDEHESVVRLRGVLVLAVAETAVIFAVVKLLVFGAWNSYVPVPLAPTLVVRLVSRNASSRT